MIGLAMMAWKLAQLRTVGYWSRDFWPWSESDAIPGTASFEYYCILDSLARGKKP